MYIDEHDVEQILELSARSDIYDHLISSVAPSIYGFEQEKLAMVLQLFSGVTKRLPNGSRIRGDFHMLLIGNPGTSKCVKADTEVQLADGSREQIGNFVERNLDSPSAVDDGVYNETAAAVSPVRADKSVVTRQATRVWKREAPARIYQVRTTARSTIEVTPSHPLSIPSGQTPRSKRWAAGALAGAIATIPMGLVIVNTDTPTLRLAIAALYAQQSLLAGWIAHVAHGTLFGIIFTVFLADPTLESIPQS
jgi:replicative DNA helicase Mcm